MDSFRATPASGVTPTARIEQDGERTAVGTLPAGRFSYRPGTRTVWWSAPAVPGQIEHLGVDTALDRVHHGDHELLTRALTGRQRFCLRLRIHGVKRGLRTVIVVGEPAADGVDGFYIELTAALRAEGAAVVDQSVTRYLADHAVVEQAVGMLRLVYGIPADRAREILAWRATETGLPVEQLAGRLCAVVSAQSPAPPAIRSRFDDLLLTARDVDSG